MTTTFRNIRDDGVIKVADAAERLLLIPSDGDLVEQLSDNKVYAYHAATATWVFIGGGTPFGFAFGIIQTPSGTFPTATSFSDTLTFTSSDGSITIIGNSTTDTVDFTSTFPTLTNAHIFVGNASNVATDVPLSGDATLANTGALTLNTVNVSPGSFGSVSTSLSATVNSKGLITSLSSQSIQITESQVTGLTTDLVGKVSKSGDSMQGPLTFDSGSGGVYEQFGAQSLGPSSASNVFRLYGDSTGRFTWKGPGSGKFSATFETTGLTINRVYTWPDQDGTVALTSSGGGGSGGVAYFNSSGVITSDSTTFFFDDSSKNLVLGSSSVTASALLKMVSTTKGFLPPVMTGTQRDAITSPTAGLMVYSTTDNNHYFYNSSAWTTMGFNTIGTIDSVGKSSNGISTSGNTLYMQTADASFPGLWSTGGQTLPGAKVMTGAQTSSLGTITSSIPGYSIVQTWNNAGITFNGFLIDITSTASATASTFVDFKLGGVSAFSVTKAGGITGATIQVPGNSRVSNVGFTNSTMTGFITTGSVLDLGNGANNNISWTSALNTNPVAGPILAFNMRPSGAYTQSLVDIQVAGTSTFGFSGATTSPLLTVTAASGSNNAKILFTGQGNNTDLTVGSSNAAVFPNSSYVITSSARLNLNGGGTGGSGSILIAGTIITVNQKPFTTSNGRTWLTTDEGTGNVQARVTFGPTAIVGTATSIGAFMFNGAVTGTATDTVLLAGIRSTQAITPNAVSPLIIGKDFSDSFTASANNQILIANRINPTAFTNASLISLVNRVLDIVQPTSTFAGSGVAQGILFTGGVLSTMTASTEVVDINFNLTRNVQWAAGTLATQRAFLIQPPTYAFTSSSTLTDAVTFEVSGAPVQGTNATLTRAWTARFIGNTAISTKLYVGSSVTTPTAIIHLAAGSTGANSAPIKLTSGSLQTSAESGTNEYNGSFYKTNASTVRIGIGGVIFNSTTDVPNSGTSETDLYTNTLTAGILANDNESIESEYTVTSLGSATATTQNRLYFGGTLIYDSGLLGLSVSTDFFYIVRVIRESSTVVKCSVTATTTTASAAPYTVYTRITGLTLSNTQILKITGTRAGVGAASADINGRFSKGKWMPAAAL